MPAQALHPAPTMPVYFVSDRGTCETYSPASRLIRQRAHRYSSEPHSSSARYHYGLSPWLWI